jgi:hypothetical protein
MFRYNIKYGMVEVYPDMEKKEILLKVSHGVNEAWEPYEFTISGDDAETFSRCLSKLSKEMKK